MNKIFFGLIFIAFGFTCFQQVNHIPSQDTISPMAALSQSVIDSSKSAVTLAIGLIGIMAFFLGLMKVAENGGLLKSLNYLLRPFLIKLFPDIPKDHPAMGSIIMNMSANMMGLANAATPFGIKAMQELEEINPKKGTASDSMILFLALNTSSVTLLPTGVIALRASAGSMDPAGILPTTLFATFCSTVTAVIVAKLFTKFKNKNKNIIKAPKVQLNWPHYLFAISLLSAIPLLIFFGANASPYMIPVLIVSIFLYGLVNKVPIYEAMVDGAKDGFNIAVKIIPFLVTILVGIGMFRASGALDFFVNHLSKVTNLFGLPGEALPMALLRPLSGSGAYGVLAATIENPSIGPDSYVGYLVSTIQGSTETTFYVLAVYFGAVQIKKMRHALPVALIADLAGVIGAVIACQWMFGHLIN